MLFCDQQNSKPDYEKKHDAARSNRCGQHETYINDNKGDTNHTILQERKAGYQEMAKVVILQ